MEISQTEVCGEISVREVIPRFPCRYLPLGPVHISSQGLPEHADLLKIMQMVGGVPVGHIVLVARIGISTFE